MAPPIGVELVETEILAEVRQEQSPALRPPHADRLAEELVGDLVTPFGGGGQEGLLPEGFGIEQQAVHIEDHRAWTKGQCHAAPRVRRAGDLPRSATPSLARGSRGSPATLALAC